MPANRSTNASDTDKLESAQRDVAEAAQDQFIAAVKSQQKMALDAATVWMEQMGKMYPKTPASVASQVREQVEKSNEMYEQLFEAHREFTSNLLNVLVPVDKD
jgi:exoribonuclease II